MDIQTAISTIKDTSKLLPQIYEDLARPGVIQVGKALESVLGLSNTIMLPIKLLNEKSNAIFIANMDKYRKKLEEIPEEKINQVPPQLGLPIIDKFTYISEDELSDLFINLLSSASNIDSFSLTHPSFVQLIDRISVDEARILNHLIGVEFIPFIGFNLNKVEGGGYLNLQKYLTGFEKILELVLPQNINLYIDNLKSMGLIYTDDLSIKQIDEMYDIIKELYKLEIDKIEENEIIGFTRKISIQKGYFEITELGKKFILSCTKKISSK